MRGAGWKLKLHSAALIKNMDLTEIWEKPNFDIGINFYNNHFYLSFFEKLAINLDFQLLSY